MRFACDSRAIELLAPLCLGLCLCACNRDRITEADFAKVKKGMTRQEVEQVLGTPKSVSTYGDETRLNYRSGEGLQDVVLKNGKVYSFYGRSDAD